MKRILVICAVCISAFCSKGFATISFANFQGCLQSSLTTLTCTASMNIAAGDTVILYASQNSTGFTYTVNDTCGQAWTHQSGASFAQGTAVQIDAWTVSSAIAGTCSITVTRSGTASRRFQWVAASYSGAILGAMTGTGTGISRPTCSISLTTEDANDVVVAGFATPQAETYTANTGVLEGQENNSPGASALSDNTAATPGAITNSVNQTRINAACAAGAIELRSNLSSIAYPIAAPNVGGSSSASAGTTFVDPIFGTHGVRVTAPGFDPSMVGNSNGTMSVSNGGSADDIAFNTDSTLFFVSNSGGTHYLVELNPTTLAIARPYATNTSGCPLNAGNCSVRGGWAVSGTSLAFSEVNANTLYAGKGTQIQSYTFDAPNFVTPPNPVTVFDFQENAPAGCTGTACNCLPSDFGTPTWTDDPGTVLGDAMFGRAFSSVNYHVGSNTGQNSGFLVGVWQAGKGCLMYNTSTGAISADLGWSGTSGLSCSATSSPQCTGTSTAPGTFAIHNIKFNRPGNRMAIAWTNCLSGTCRPNVPYIWDLTAPTTVSISEDTPGLNSGHWALGQLGMINDPGQKTGQYVYRQTPTSARAVNDVPSPVCTKSLDGHQAWQMANATDSNPFGFTRTTNSLGTFGLLPFDQPSTYGNCPWWGEIDLAAMDGSMQVFRKALTFNTGFNPSFNVQNAIAEFSQDGRFVIVGSDWFNSLGNAASNSSSCTPAGPTWNASTARAAGYILTPAAANNSSGFSFQAQNVGTSGTTEPTWASTCSTVGSTCTDGAITWKNIGLPTGTTQCRSDVFLWKID
jgi:hypothetical protein